MTSKAESKLTGASRALITATLQRVAERSDAILIDVHEAIAASAPERVAADPALSAEIERSNSTIFAAWLVSNLQRPGEPVDPVLNANTLDIVRDIARRGLDDLTENYFRVGQSVMSEHVMTAAFELSGHPEVLHDALATMLRSATDYVDRTVAALRDLGARERELRASGGKARRLDIATALVEGDETDSSRASALLGFELERPLLACIVWTDPSEGPDVGALEQIARELASAHGATSLLAIPASAASVWAWFVSGQPVDSGALRAVIDPTSAVRVAIGSRGAGVRGMRQGHVDALLTQRVMHQMGNGIELATHDEVRAVSLARGDEPMAVEFIASALGPLATAAPELRTTLRALVTSGFNTVAVADQLGVHRNTVLARMRRAERLLSPKPEGRWIAIGLALELDWWRGGQGRQPAR